MYSSAPHWVLDTTENCFPSQRHERVPDLLSDDSKTNKVYTFSKDYPTKVDATAWDPCTPEGNKNESIKTHGNEQGGSRSEMSKGPDT